MSIKNKLKRGFTLVELMIVVAIVGVLAALAIYGVRKYIANAKTAEAKNSLGQMTKDASTAYARESMAATVLGVDGVTAIVNNICLGAGATVPDAAAKIKGQKYQSGPANWNADNSTTGWRCLKFSMSDPQYYMYDYDQAGSSSAAGGTFTCRANGDLNGDDTLSTFEMDGKIVATGNVREVFVSPNLRDVLPEE